MSHAPRLIPLVVLLMSSTIAWGDHAARNGLLESGWRAYRQGDLAGALKTYQEAAAAAPNDASVWYDLGCLYALTRDSPRAQSAWGHALALNPRLAQAYDAIGQLYELNGEMPTAHALYTTADTHQPRNAKFLRHLIRTLFALHNDAAARQALQALLHVAPEDVEARYQLGVLELRANAPDLAITAFQKAVKRDPQHVMAWNGLALAYARIGAFQDAAQALEHAKALQPASAPTLTNAGLLAARQQDWGTARVAWQQALQVDPQFEPAIENLKTLEAFTTPSP